jgi:glycosyltransferase involved in cell wall biosynthesis
LVPIRTPAAGAHDQIDEGVNGFIIPFEDDDALAKRLEQLFHSKDLTTHMTQAALSSAREKFTTQIMVEKTIKVYEEVLNKVNNA